MYIGWEIASASIVQVQMNNTAQRKIPDYNIANFDVLKLPVLEVRFYTPRSGGVASVLDAIIHTSCLSWSHHQ